MLFCKNITKSFGSQLLLENADFQLNKGERVGIIGRNGYGKSTLFRVIQGSDILDEGDISYPEHYKIGALDQHLVFTEKTIVDEVAQVLHVDQQHDVWKAEKMLSGLGFLASDFGRSPDEFSGGYQIRIKLAQLLLSEPDLLLLDEPTNYLDITSIRWLESFLASWKGEVLCVSHDQTFLENAMTHTALIHRRRIKKIKGTPQKLYTQVEQEEEIHEKTRLAQDKDTKRQEKFIREFRSGARSAGLVQSRIKMLEKKQILDVLPPIPPIKFAFTETGFVGARLLELRNISFGYEEGQDLLKKISLELNPHEKVGIIGANGKGKTTLLKLIAGELDAQSGVYKKHIAVKEGYFGQSNVDRLDPQKNIIEELNAGKGESEQFVRSIASSLLFSGDTAYKKIEVLSGGEKARVNLGKILLTPVNLLLLDEPTNHLDYESVEALIKSVNAFSGGVLFVSHDEHFLRSVAEKLIVFDGDDVFVFEGNYDRFLAERGFVSEQIENDVSMEEKKKKPVHREQKKERERILRPLKRKLERIEKEIALIENAQKENKVLFEDAERRGNRIKMDTYGVEYQDLQRKLLPLLEEWESISIEIEKQK